MSILIFAVCLWCFLNAWFWYESFSISSLQLYSSFFLLQVKDTVQVDHNVSRHLGDELSRDDWHLLVSTWYLLISIKWTFLFDLKCLRCFFCILSVYLGYAYFICWIKFFHTYKKSIKWWIVLSRIYVSKKVLSRTIISFWYLSLVMSVMMSLN